MRARPGHDGDGAAAGGSAQSFDPSEHQGAEAIVEAIKAPKLPIGWTHAAPRWWQHIPGWLLTALAASLGAPFLFNGPQRLLSLRNSGAKPVRADESRAPRPGPEPPAAPAGEVMPPPSPLGNAANR